MDRLPEPQHTISLQGCPGWQDSIDVRTQLPAQPSLTQVLLERSRKPSCCLPWNCFPWGFGSSAHAGRKTASWSLVPHTGPGSVVTLETRPSVRGQAKLASWCQGRGVAMPNISCSFETAGRVDRETRLEAKTRLEVSPELREAILVPGNARGTGFEG